MPVARSRSVVSWARPEERSPDRARKYVVEIEVQLRDHTHVLAGARIDRDDRGKTGLAIFSGPDQARQHFPGNAIAVRPVGGHLEIELDDRNEPVEWRPEADVANVRLQIGNAVLDREIP